GNTCVARQNWPPWVRPDRPREGHRHTTLGSKDNPILSAQIGPRTAPSPPLPFMDYPDQQVQDCSLPVALRIAARASFPRQYRGSSRISPRNRRANADGTRCPCSQERTVGSPTPRKAANKAWLSPSDSRM